MGKTFKFLSLCAVVAILSFTCCGAPKCGISTNPSAAPYDSARKALGDSVLNIILKSDKVTITKRQLVGDEVRDVTALLATPSIDALKFLVTAPDNFVSNDTIYGNFIPTYFITVKHKKSHVKILYDLSTGKWGLDNAVGKQLIMRDLKSDELKRFFNLIDGSLTAKPKK